MRCWIWWHSRFWLRPICLIFDSKHGNPKARSHLVAGFFTTVLREAVGLFASEQIV